MLLRAFVLVLVALSFAPSLEAQVAPPDGAQFAASSRGRVYYWVGCDNWKRLSSRNLRFFRTAAEAERAGYEPSQARGCAPQLETALITPTPNGSAGCVVQRIVDGDTFQCQGGSRVRLLIADADEVGQSVYADSATLLLRRLMPVGATVRLEFDVSGHDRYRRVLAYVYAEDVFVNRELVRRGYAQVAVYPPNVKWVEVMRAAVDSAREEKVGVWRGSAFECAPADFRAGRCRGY
jgi:endonuclease YncB( thermonuclease family)